MVQEPDYIIQLRELYENYPGKELESALGVTIRSIQNYLKKEERTTPGKEVIGKIREAFANYKEGRAIADEGQDTAYESRRTLERTLENLSEDKIRSTAIIERLVTMLERQFSSGQSRQGDQSPDLTGKTKETPPVRERLPLGKKNLPANKIGKGDK